MCSGIALALSELPLELLHEHGLERRIHDRGGEKEVHFLYRYANPCLPLWVNGQLRIARWGNADGACRGLPRTGWTWLETVENGGWAGCNAQKVDIPATMGLERGIWFRVRQGMRGLLVMGPEGQPIVYMICEPSSYYYRIMTRSQHMPLLIGERI